MQFDEEDNDETGDASGSGSGSGGDQEEVNQPPPPPGLPPKYARKKRSKLHKEKKTSNHHGKKKKKPGEETEGEEEGKNEVDSRDELEKKIKACVKEEMGKINVGDAQFSTQKTRKRAEALTWCEEQFKEKTLMQRCVEKKEKIFRESAAYYAARHDGQILRAKQDEIEKECKDFVEKVEPCVQQLLDLGKSTRKAEKQC